MGKEYNEFINYSVEEFKKKTVGRYYVLSWVPVRSVHNPQRCQVKYRRWKPGDIYTEPIPIENVIVTKPMGVKIPVVTRREEQVAVSERYEEVSGEKVGGKVEQTGLVVLVIGIIVAAWLLLMGRR